MTDPLSRVRDIALLLPATQEVRDGADVEYRVEGQPFARLAPAGGLRLRDGGDSGGWTDMSLDDADWTRVEDRIAQAWERHAPAGLLEAGGR